MAWYFNNQCSMHACMIHLPCRKYIPLQSPDHVTIIGYDSEHVTGPVTFYQPQLHAHLAGTKPYSMAYCPHFPAPGPQEKKVHIPGQFLPIKSRYHRQLVHTLSKVYHRQLHTHIIISHLYKLGHVRVTLHHPVN